MTSNTPNNTTLDIKHLLYNDTNNTTIEEEFVHDPPLIIVNQIFDDVLHNTFPKGLFAPLT